MFILVLSLALPGLFVIGLGFLGDEMCSRSSSGERFAPPSAISLQQGVSAVLSEGRAGEGSGVSHARTCTRKETTLVNNRLDINTQRWCVTSCYVPDGITHLELHIANF